MSAVVDGSSDRVLGCYIVHGFTANSANRHQYARRIDKSVDDNNAFWAKKLSNIL
jgi:hypothetical protein